MLSQWDLAIDAKITFGKNILGHNDKKRLRRDSLWVANNHSIAIIGVLSALNSSITKPRLNNIEIKLNYLHTLLSILNAPIVLESTLKTLNINIPTNQDVYSTLVYMIKNNLINIDQLLNLLVDNNISSINNTLIFNDSY